MARTYPGRERVRPDFRAAWTGRDPGQSAGLPPRQVLAATAAMT